MDTTGVVTEMENRAGQAGMPLAPPGIDQVIAEPPAGFDAAWDGEFVWTGAIGADGAPCDGSGRDDYTSDFETNITKCYGGAKSNTYHNDVGPEERATTGNTFGATIGNTTWAVGGKADVETPEMTKRDLLEVLLNKQPNIYECVVREYRRVHTVVDGTVDINMHVRRWVDERIGTVMIYRTELDTSCKGTQQDVLMISANNSVMTDAMMDTLGGKIRVGSDNITLLPIDELIDDVTTSGAGNVYASHGTEVWRRQDVITIGVNLPVMSDANIVYATDALARLTGGAVKFTRIKNARDDDGNLLEDKLPTINSGVLLPDGKTVRDMPTFYPSLLTLVQLTPTSMPREIRISARVNKGANGRPIQGRLPNFWPILSGGPTAPSSTTATTACPCAGTTSRASTHATSATRHALWRRGRCTRRATDPWP